jgi:hypothetical protein
MSRDGPSPNNILGKPEHILSFIKHALQNDTTLQDSVSKRTSQKSGARQGLTMGDLRIVPQDEQDEDLDDTGDDSDDETLESEVAQPNDEMTITALNLLLSLLEGTSFCFKAVTYMSLTTPISKSEPLRAVSSRPRGYPQGCGTPS